MKTNFSPQFFRGAGNPGNPGGQGGGAGLLNAAAGSTPWGAAAQTAIGLAQTIGGWIKQKKATKALEKLPSPSYTQNQGIKDFYDKALQRYNISPYSTTLYKKTIQDVGRGTTQGLDSLRGRGGAVAGVNNLIATQNDNLLKAAAMAEDKKAQEFNVLGTATGMKAGEDRMAFDINQRQPFERKYNLLAMKAGGGNQIMNSGISNLYGGASSGSQMAMLAKLYGGG